MLHFGGTTAGKGPLDDLGVDGRITPNWIIKNNAWGLELDYLVRVRHQLMALVNTVMNQWLVLVNTVMYQWLVLVNTVMYQWLVLVNMVMYQLMVLVSTVMHFPDMYKWGKGGS
jgi:hypothetical protein